LLHGLGETSVACRPVHEQLSRSFDVITMDLPGFGGSPALPDGQLPTASALADAVERQMDELGIGDFHVAGNSLGARVSFELAARGRVLSMIAIAPDGLGTPTERVYQSVVLTAARLLATALLPVATALTPPGRAGRPSSWPSGPGPGS
jgi:pimeloyl-ACP methyl ester carboxylesterase